MISAVRTTKHARGFTLIEIVMVLAIAAVIMGGALGMMIFSSDDRALRNAGGEIELLAKRARVTSILHQTPYALEFREGIVRLLPLAQAGMKESKNLRGRLEESASDDPRILLEPGMNLSIRHWNSEKWLPAVKTEVHVWRFDPDGLCEPLSIHLGFGQSWIEDTYHPLTATAILAEKRSEVK